MPTRAKLSLPKNKPHTPAAKVEPKAVPSARSPSRQGRRMIGGHFSQAMWRHFRELGVALSKTNQDLLQEALDDLLVKYRKG
jgi:hypothetical protein